MCQFSMGLSDRFLTNRVARSVSFILFITPFLKSLVVPVI